MTTLNNLNPTNENPKDAIVQDDVLSPWRKLEPRKQWQAKDQKQLLVPLLSKPKSGMQFSTNILM